MKLEAQLPFLHVYTLVYYAHTILQTLYLATIWQSQTPPLSAGTYTYFKLWK